MPTKTLRIKPTMVSDFINANGFNTRIFDHIGYGPFEVTKEPHCEDWAINNMSSYDGYYITTSEIKQFFDVDEPEVEAVCDSVDSQGPEPIIKALYDVKLGGGVLRKTEQVQLNMVVTKDNVGDLIKFLTREFDYE